MVLFLCTFSCWVCLDGDPESDKKIWKNWYALGSILRGFWKRRALSRFWRVKNAQLPPASRPDLLFLFLEGSSMPLCHAGSFSPFRPQLPWPPNMNKQFTLLLSPMPLSLNMKDIQAISPTFSALCVLRLIEIYSKIHVILFKCLHTPGIFYLILNHQSVSQNWQVKLPKVMLLKHPVSVLFHLQWLIIIFFFQLF